MKRFFFSAMMLTAVVAGCTKSSVLETAPSFETPIVFEPYAGKAPITKATVTDLDALKISGFRVTGFVHDALAEPYLEKDVTWNSQTPSWTYSGIAYWPAEGTMDFVAYGKNAYKNATVNAVTQTPLIVPTEGSYTEFTYYVPDYVAEQEDLVVAKPFVGQAKVDKVTFDFKHVLSKVGFSVIANNDNNVNITIKNITLKGIFKNSGKVNLLNDTPSISSASTTTTVSSYSLFDHSYSKGTQGSNTFDGFVCKSSTTAKPIYINTVFTAGDLTSDPTLPNLNDEGVPTDETIKSNYDSRYLMIMPGTVADLTTGSITKPHIEVVYELTDGKEESAIVWLTKDGTNTGDNWEFLGGKAYEFVLKISTSAVGFTVDINDWVDYFAPEVDENGNPKTDENGNIIYPNGNGENNLVPVE